MGIQSVHYFTAFDAKIDQSWFIDPADFLSDIFLVSVISSAEKAQSSNQHLYYTLERSEVP